MYIQQYLDKMDFIPKKANLDSLNTLIAKHIQLFAFSSINVLLERELSLEKAPLFERVINQNCGGYCFEHNKIFNIVLKELGYEVKTVMARIVLGGHLINSRTHRVNIISISGQDYLVDVGFGSLGPAGAILVESKFNTVFNFTSYNVFKQDGEFHLQLLKKDTAPLTLYVFDDVRYTEKDCDQGHFYSHKYPEAIFVNNLVVSKILKDKTIHVLNREFFIENGQTKEAFEIQDQEHLSEILGREFNIKLSSSDSQVLFNKTLKEPFEVEKISSV
jgi:N-hydroxyarylamine O-acetyltransferase